MYITKSDQPVTRRAPLRALTLLTILSSAVLAGCSSDQMFYTEDPIVARVTKANLKLRELPPPRKRIPVAVYEFADQTGQYREAASYQQLSRAVTQGGAAILIKALQDAGNRQWFAVMERNQLPNLLKERQIVTEMRRLYRGEKSVNSRVLPPLKHAAIIVEGGIVGYNQNVTTGGIGARYLGIGADTKYSRDEITVALRAVSTKTGEVLASVSARKTVVSVALQSGVFRFIKLDELLEGEAGITNNEPRQLAVEAAVEKAVESLIIEGAELDVWQFANPAAGQDYIREYRKQQFDGIAQQEMMVKAPPETKTATTIAATIPRIFRSNAKKQSKNLKTYTRKLPPPYKKSEKPVG